MKEGGSGKAVEPHVAMMRRRAAPADGPGRDGRVGMRCVKRIDSFSVEFTVSQSQSVSQAVSSGSVGH